MAKINDNYLKLPGSYLFSEIDRKVTEFTSNNPDKKIIKLGIGDVTKPLTSSILKALHSAVDEMGIAETFKGYGPYRGYEFLRQKIVEHDYIKRGIQLDIDEIFISDGAKSDTGSIGDIFSIDNKVAVCDPVYPVYVDTNAISGRAGKYNNKTGMWDNIVYMPCTKENNFVPELPNQKVDLIYICSPNNPTGTAISYQNLKKFVDYALQNEAVILFDAAYEAYITEENIPHSIYEIDGAKNCAIEFRSFSKNAGFTGTRCAFTVIPKDLKLNGVDLNSLWFRRQGTKFNGVSYIIQKAAEAVYSEEGQQETKALVDYYMNNAQIIRKGLKEAGFEVYGGINAPYIWLKTPDNMTSWEFFDYLLNKANVVGTPGSGFGPSGEGYFRLTAFGTIENTISAIDKIKLISR